MAYSLEEVVEATGESEAEILRKGVESYVDRELREARIRIDELGEQYDVKTPAELEALIEQGDIDEHPAWEDLIEWENLRTRIERLERL
jgi:hypothetical protein